MHARQTGPLNLGAKLYVRKKSQIVFVGAIYRVLLASAIYRQVRFLGVQGGTEVNGSSMRYRFSMQI